ncbi:MAG TPA: hypothetical protein VNH45_01810, partial [Gaiellaceae bacterium]|nr:hypothetical protein [Gaiellaceae bacterium]
MPGVEAARQQERPHDLALADERQELHRDADDHRPEHPHHAASCRDQISSASETNPRVGRSAIDQLSS